MNICPNCIVELKTNKRKFGNNRNFLVCPDCGYREIQNETASYNQQMFSAIDSIRANNKNQKFRQVD